MKRLNERQRRQLEEASCLHKRVKFVYPESGESIWGTIVDEISDLGGIYKSVLQKIEPDEGNEHEDGSKFSYRFGYYVYNFNHQRAFWTNRPLVDSSKTYQRLLAEARKRGWDILK